MRELRRERGIREREPDVFDVRVQVGRDPLTGRYCERMRTVRGTITLARKVRAEMLLDRARPQRATTVGELLDQWLDIADHETSTRYQHERCIELRVRPRIGRARVDRLTTRQLDELYATLARSGSATGGPLAPRTVRQAHQVLHAALELAVRWEWIGRNPARYATPPRIPRPNPTPPSPEQVRALVTAAEAEHPTLAVYLRLAAVTGARRGELCAIQWRDLDLDRGSLTICRAIGVRTKRYVKPTKTEDVRHLSLDAATVDALRAHRRRIAKLCLVAGVPLEAEGFVFARDPEGREPWAPGSVSQLFATIRDRASPAGDGVALREFRHYAATYAIDAGVPIRTVSARLGHRRTSTTTDIYAAWTRESDQLAADVLAQGLDDARRRAER